MANLSMVSLDEAKVIKLLEEAGAKSLGNFTCELVPMVVTQYRVTKLQST